MIQNSKFLYWHNLSQGLLIFDGETSKDAAVALTNVQALPKPKYLRCF